MKKLLPLLLALLVLSAASAGEQAPAPVVGVVAVTPKQITITQELNGRVTPFLIAEVRPQVNGIILRRLFEEGSDVTKDMPLYQIDPAMYEAQLASAQAQSASAQAALAKARANVDAAESKLARYDSLVTARAVNRQEYDDVEAAAKQARADIGIAEAQIGTMQAQVRIAQINVDYASVLAPISGRIGKSSVTQGALVTASQANPLAVVQQLDPIYVDVTQPVSSMLNLKEGMQAGILQNTGESHGEMRLVLDNGQTYRHPGKLLFADVTVDQTTGTISLRAEFPNPDHVLLPGMFVGALLDVARIDDAVTVPQDALRREPDGSAYVFVVGGGNAVAKRPVTALRTYGNDWLIGDGLAGGEQVIVEGTQSVAIVPGQPAPVVNPQPAANSK